MELGKGGKIVEMGMSRKVTFCRGIRPARKLRVSLVELFWQMRTGRPLRRERRAVASF